MHDAPDATDTAGGARTPDGTAAPAPGGTNPVSFTTGPPETVLPPPEPEAAEATAAAMEAAPELRRAALSSVAVRWPRHLDVWARLAEVATADADRYAFARVGYHRGLDALRAAGWRGTGLVRWTHEENRGFLRSLDALRAAAAAIGEIDEAERCRQFLHQLDPDWRDQQ
jgi:hypothetical protein